MNKHDYKLDRATVPWAWRASVFSLSTALAMLAIGLFMMRGDLIVVDLATASAAFAWCI